MTAQNSVRLRTHRILKPLKSFISFHAAAGLKGALPGIRLRAEESCLGLYSPPGVGPRILITDLAVSFLSCGGCWERVDFHELQGVEIEGDKQSAKTLLIRRRNGIPIKVDIPSPDLFEISRFFQRICEDLGRVS